MAYYPFMPDSHPVPAPYQGYDIKVSPHPVDDEQSVIVIAEVVTGLAQHFHRARKVIWWLSVDNFFKWRHINPGPDIFGQTGCIHMAQSCYAMEFLRRQEVRERYWLTDYIPSSAFTPSSSGPRLPIIAYNPRKGLEITQALIARCGDGPIWLKLEGLNQSEMAELLKCAAIYVDFGGHPGRDRIPREAALSGAVVITGRRGAAGFPGDLPLPDRFRLDERRPDFEIAAAALINELLGSEQVFLDASAEQEAYLQWIGRNREIFMNEVDHFINVLTLRAETSACQSLQPNN